MSVSEGLFYFFGAISTLNGLLFSAYLFFLVKTKTVSTRLLGALLLFLSLKLSDSVFSYFDPANTPLYLKIGLSACFLIGPTLYFYTKSCIYKSNIFFKSALISYTPFILLIVIGAIFPYEAHNEFWRRYIVKFVYAVWILFLILTCIFYIRHRSKFNKNLHFDYFLAGNIVFYLGFSGIVDGAVCVIGSIALTLLIYLKIYEVFSKKEIGNPQKPFEKYQNKRIPDQQAEALLQKVEKIMVEEKLYNNPDIKLGDLAQRLNMTNHQLSQLLNDNLQKSFSNFINEYRIKEACHLIMEQPHIRIEEIGYDVGFNSKSTFFTAFKKFAGTTPTLYKNLQQNELNNGFAV